VGDCLLDINGFCVFEWFEKIFNGRLMGRIGDIPFGVGLCRVAMVIGEL
jgi:hypothetical protein